MLDIKPQSVKTNFILPFSGHNQTKQIQENPDRIAPSGFSLFTLYRSYQNSANASSSLSLTGFFIAFPVRDSV